MYRSEELAQIARLAELINPGHAAAKAEQYLKVLLFQSDALAMLLRSAMHSVVHSVMHSVMHSECTL